MRAISTAQNAILTVQAQGGAQNIVMRCWTKDGAGNWRDLTNYALGENLVKSLTWREGIDDPGITWEATFIREAELLSLAPLVTTSALNRGFVPTGPAYDPLLQVGRQMRFEWYLASEDDPVTIPNAFIAVTAIAAFTGYIDSINAAGDGEIHLTGRGLEAQLIDNYIERERVYAFAQGGSATAGCYIFELNRAYLVGDLVLPTNANLNGHYYRVSTAGTSSATVEPTWPTGAGATVANGAGALVFTESGATSNTTGTAVETVMQQLLTDNASGVTLWCPVSPAWAVKWFNVTRQPLFDELRALADQIGWCLRYVWDPTATDLRTGTSTGAMRLKLYDPNRANTTSARTFQKGDQLDIKRAEVSIHDIRNAVNVVYSDSQDLDSAGIPKRKVIAVTDSASITKYGRRFCEIDEASTSNIDTSAEATTLANAVLSDLSEPTADFEVEVRLFPFVEVTDLYTLAANGVHFDVDEKLAVVGYDHSHSAADSTTTIRMRGKPSSAASKWQQIATDGKSGEVHALQTLDASVAHTVTNLLPMIGGMSGVIQASGYDKANRQTDFELHVSTSNGFTPTAATLKTVSSEKSFALSDLDPSKAYYARLVPLVMNGRKRVQGLPSAQFAITPARAQSTHLNSDVIWGRLPLNGGFETQFDSLAMPDFWSFTGAGPPVFGTDIQVATTSGISGGQYLKVKTSTTSMSTNIFSAWFAVNELAWYAPSMWRKCVSGGADTVGFAIQWADISKSVIGAYSETFPLNDSVGTWVKQRLAASQPTAGARFARLNVYLLNTATAVKEVDVDEVVWNEDERWHYVGASGEPAFANSWVNYAAGGFQVARFMREASGFVVVEGLVKSGTLGAAIFTLPVGYRPPSNLSFAVTSNAAFGIVEVLTGGVIDAPVGSNVYVALNARFRTE